MRTAAPIKFKLKKKEKKILFKRKITPTPENWTDRERGK